ncbi:MAG TPA: hypothetical protein VGS98_07260 [Thermoanaerobaculia bacterium]|jgi:hypothetical protein|nr:hypothetical protein [Thermoanaerobaculia bacterium]
MPKTRRAILKAAGVISALAALPLPAQTRTPAPGASPTPTPGKKAPGTLAKLARERYGRFLTEEEMALMDDDMEALERRSARLRGYKLGNGEEPAVDFVVVRR